MEEVDSDTVPKDDEAVDKTGPDERKTTTDKNKTGVATPPKIEPVEVASFCERMKKLLVIERDGEVGERKDNLSNLSLVRLQEKGVALLNLKVSDHKNGLGGLVLITFVHKQSSSTKHRQNKTCLLPAHKLSSGDPALLQWKGCRTNFSALASGDGGSEASRPGTVDGVQGVVVRVSSTSVVASFKEIPDEKVLRSIQLRLIQLPDEHTHRIYCRTLERLAKYDRLVADEEDPLPCRIVRSVCFAHEMPHRSSSSASGTSTYVDVTAPAPPVGSHATTVTPGSLAPFNAELNSSQWAAVTRSLSSRDVSIIHGPPGTGKTSTVVELVRQYVARGEKVLCCAPSNVAVDTLAERLSACRTTKRPLRLLRVGHPARVMPSVMEHSLAAMLYRSDGAQVVREIEREVTAAQQKLAKAKRSDEKRAIGRELRTLRRELKQREKRAVTDLVRTCDVVLATCTGSYAYYLRRSTFDVCVIDEAAQALEIACWIPAMKARKLVLAGDHKQLPPTIKSDKAARGGLSTTLLDRMVRTYGNRVVSMLDTQYRMHQRIMKWSSDELYRSKLRAHDSVATHLLSDLDGVAEDDHTSTPLLLVDTAGCFECEETLVEGDGGGGGGGSYANDGEVELCRAHVHRLISAGVSPHQIAVIAPYRAQVARLRDRLHDPEDEVDGGGGVGLCCGVEIGTVDGFQGREKEAVVISMTRSNEKGLVGFLQERRRMNVAITRARRHVCVICNSETVAKNKFLGRIVAYFEENGEYLSAMTAGDEGAVTVVHVAAPATRTTTATTTTTTTATTATAAAASTVPATRTAAIITTATTTAATSTPTTTTTTTATATATSDPIPTTKDASTEVSAATSMNTSVTPVPRHNGELEITADGKSEGGNAVDDDDDDDGDSDDGDSDDDGDCTDGGSSGNGFESDVCDGSGDDLSVPTPQAQPQAKKKNQPPPKKKQRASVPRGRGRGKGRGRGRGRGGKGNSTNVAVDEFAGIPPIKRGLQRDPLQRLRDMGLIPKEGEKLPGRERTSNTKRKELERKLNNKIDKQVQGRSRQQNKKGEKKK